MHRLVNPIAPQLDAVQCAHRRRHGVDQGRGLLQQGSAVRRIDLRLGVQRARQLDVLLLIAVVAGRELTLKLDDRIDQLLASAVRPCAASASASTVDTSTCSRRRSSVFIGQCVRASSASRRLRSAAG